MSKMIGTLIPVFVILSLITTSSSSTQQDDDTLTNIDVFKINFSAAGIGFFLSLTISYLVSSFCISAKTMAAQKKGRVSPGKLSGRDGEHRKDSPPKFGPPRWLRLPKGGEASNIYKKIANSRDLSSTLLSLNEYLDWGTRLRIGIGLARGLAWLHHRFPVPLVHQNLSSSAVLLDCNHEPRIADFGLARIVKPSNSERSTKRDVYEFGVILLELATGEVNDRNVNIEENSVRRAIKLYSTGRVLEAIDESLRGKGHEDEIVEFLRVAFSCVLSRPEARPCMHKAYRALKRIGAGRRNNEISEQDDNELSLVYNMDNAGGMVILTLPHFI